jgi:hypothetical protein
MARRRTTVLADRIISDWPGGDDVNAVFNGHGMRSFTSRGDMTRPVSNRTSPISLEAPEPSFSPVIVDLAAAATYG